MKRLKSFRKDMSVVRNEKIKKFICKIICDGIDKGTGFLIDKKIVMTAAHVIEEDTQKLSVQFLEMNNSVLEISCKAYEEKSDLDVEILILDEPLNLNESMNLNTNTVSIGSSWTTYGYPAESSPQIALVEGVVTNANDSFNPCDFNIDLEVHQGIMENYQGLSGAPLIIAGKVYGIITHQNGLKLKAIEFSRFKDYLVSLNLEYIFHNSDKNICNVEIIESEVIEDFDSTEKLNDVIKEQTGCRVLIEGSVGIGKSTFVQQYTGTEDIVILGKYFIKIPNDLMPISYRISEDVFCEWLEAKISDYLKMRRESTEKLSYSKRVEYLSSLFLELSKKLQEEDKKAVIFIDGIDELLNYSQSEIQRFLSFIPAHNSKNIFFVITSNNHLLLPMYFLQTIDLENDRIELQPFCQQQTKQYLQRVLNKPVSNTQLDVLAQKSFGHPLYLSYIINYLSLVTVDALDASIDELPVYSGSIKVYYDFLWSKISQNTYQLHWVAYLARVRSIIDAQTFRNLLPNEIKIHFEPVLNQLKYLLIKGKTLAFFHNSFSDYIKNATEYMGKEIHHQIGVYCLENKEIEFSIINILFHLANGNDEDIARSINECNQEWVDKCTIQNVTPDLMIQDAKEILKLACVNGDYVSAIRMLLLLERIEFRFNQMFIDSAFEIAKAEISLNRPDKAMQYIIRQGVLLLTIDETLYCLEMLTDKGYSQQAKEIVTKLEAIFINSIEQRQGIPYEFFGHILQAYQMYSEFDRHYSTHKSKIILNMLQDNFDEVKSDKNERAMNDIVGSAHSYFLWKYNKYIDLDTTLEIGLEANKNISDLFIQMLLCARDNEEQYHKKYVPDYHNIANDIERLIQIASTTNIHKAVEVLIEGSKNYDLVKSLISQCKDYKAYETIRAENGVDVSWSNFSSTFYHYRNQAYLLLLTLEDVKFSKSLFISDWENGLLKFIQYVATLYGRALYCRTVNNYDIIENDYTDLIYKIENELFNFDDRTKWNHSYHIPEEILPFLFKYITKYIVQFKSEKIEQYINIVKIKANNQFGIYSEGYFEVLFEVVYTFITNQVNVLEIQSIVDLLYEDIKIKVLNRWERTPMLLQLVEIYSILGCNEKSNEVYNEMLKTSMGPTWYKEAQLSLLSECFSPMNAEDITIDLIRRNFVLLDTASGGMTFERFVRVEKEELIGELWNKGFYDIAIKFLKTQVYPDIQSLEFNIGVEQVDANQYGLKNNRVANSIFLDSAISNILEQNKADDNCIIWAVSEIFMFGDERYLSDFIHIQSDTLNSMYQISSSILKSYINRTVSILVCDCDERRLYNFLRIYKKYVHPEIFNSILRKISTILDVQIEAIKIEINNAISRFTEERTKTEAKDEDLEKDRDDLFLEGTFGRFSALDASRKAMQLAQEEKSKGNIGRANEYYAEGLSDIHNGGWNIWSNNAAEEVTECLGNIHTLCEKPTETVKQLVKFITNENYCNKWEIAHRLYNLISGTCGKTEQHQITGEILNHLETIVIPNEKYISKYSNIRNENYKDNPNEALLDLILWFAWYPDNFVSQKAIELFLWVVKENPRYMTNIVNHCFDDDINNAELCVTLCLYLADNEDPLLWQGINNYNVLGKVISCKYFIVKSTFLQIYSNFLNDHPEASSFIETINHYFETITERSDVKKVEDDSKIRLINRINRERIFYRLESHAFEAKGIKSEVSAAIEEQVSPKTVFQLYKLDFALSKSFQRNTMHLGYIDTMLYGNLNRILGTYISHEKSARIANDIRRVNPYFPVQKLKSYSGFKRAAQLKKLLYEETQDPFQIQESLYDDTNTILYYHNYDYNNKILECIELIAYIIPRHFEIQDYYMDISSREGNYYSGEYISVTQSISNNVICPVETITPEIVQGRAIMPGFPSTTFKAMISVDDAVFQKDLWLSGRVWSEYVKGIPLHEGCSIRIPTNLLSNIPSDKKIVYMLSDGEETIIIDTYKRSISRIGGVE